jgi:integrase
VPKLTKHPGVALIRTKAGLHRARWRDPDKGKPVWYTFPKVANVAVREKFARDQSRSLALRKLELDSGAPVTRDPVELKAAVADYFKAHPRLRASTVLAYRNAADELIDFVDGRPLTKGLLQAFAGARANLNKHAPVKGGKRYEYKPTGALRSARSVNRELRAVQTILEWARSREKLQITRDDIRDSLKRAKVGQADPKPLFADNIRELLITCAEHEPAIRPFVVFLLLTGMRAGEARLLRWSQVNLKEGYITLSPEDTKTARGRQVDIDPPSPALHALLESLPRTKDRVFPLTKDEIKGARTRLAQHLKWKFTYQQLRQTCASYSCSWPAFGPFLSAKRLGHSTEVADRLYARAVRGIPANCEDLESAMGIRPLVSPNRD